MKSNGRAMSDSEHPLNNPFDEDLSLEQELDIDQAFEFIETKLQALKGRYQTIQTSQQKQTQLGEQLETLQDKTNSTKPDLQKSKLHDEIREIQEQLKIVEIDLESRLMDVLTLPDKVELFKILTLPDKAEWFWHFLKYAGLGFGAALLLGHFTK